MVELKQGQVPSTKEALSRTSSGRYCQAAIERGCAGFANGPHPAAGRPRPLSPSQADSVGLASVVGLDTLALGGNEPTLAETSVSNPNSDWMSASWISRAVRLCSCSTG